MREIIAIAMFFILVFTPMRGDSQLEQPTSEEEVRLEIESTPKSTVENILLSLSSQSEELLSQQFDTRTSSLLRRNQINEVISAFPQLINTH